MKDLQALDEALDYLNEGIFNIFKKKKKSTAKVEQHKPMCTEEEYNQYIKKDVDKIYKMYIDATKKAMKEFKDSEKYINEFIDIDQTPDEDSIIDYGETTLYYIDFRKYSNLNHMDAGDASIYIGSEFVYKFGNAVKKNINKTFEGVSFHSLAEGMDWDDIFSSITFSREFFNSRIKKED